MTEKPVIPRQLAHQDVEAAISYYLSEDAPKAALGFIDALASAFSHIGRHPCSGSARYAHEVDIPGLCCRGLQRFPYLVFYLEQDAAIDVWRVLHESRDIPAWMHESDGATDVLAKDQLNADRS